MRNRNSQNMRLLICHNGQEVMIAETLRVDFGRKMWEN